MLLGVLATLVVAEGLVRALGVPPRVQVVRAAARPELTWHGDVPLWPRAAAAPRHHWDCLEQRPDAPVVLVLGDSILAGVFIEPERVWSRLVEQGWSEGEPPCLLNLAEAGYSLQNEVLSAELAAERVSPDHLIVELWRNAGWDYTRVGDTAYRFRGLQRSADGTPNPLGLPGTLHRSLLPRSRLYELTTLAVAPSLPEKPERGLYRQTLLRRLEDLQHLADQHDASMLFVGVPELDRPFAQHAEERIAWSAKQADQGDVLARTWARERGHGVVELDELLAAAGQDHEAIRLDACCHYNEVGQGAVARALTPAIEHLVTPREP